MHDTLAAPCGDGRHSDVHEKPQLVAGRYEILGLVGAGGMGSVYRVRDTHLGEIVALKMLRPDLAGAPGMLDRFREEARLARRVTHQNVARTFDIGEHGDDWFLTMEYAGGGSLEEALEQVGPMPIERVVEVVASICAGLSAAHAAGVVHRDLKPENVLFDDAGRILITDFGIARALHGAAGTETGEVVVGTPMYMAPEQLGGARIDARADLYAVGAIAYELLTAEPPWTGGGMFAIAAARLHAPAPDPRSRRPDVPDALAAIVLRCMAREPEARFQSAAAIVAELGKTGLARASGEASADRESLPPSSKRARPAASTKTVAVLPFRNAGDPADDHVADGFTEDVTDTLSMTPGLRLRPTGLLGRVSRAPADPRQLGRDLGVQVVVDGSVRVAGDAAHVHVRLVAVAEGFQIWAKRFESRAGELLAVAHEAALAIAVALTSSVASVKPREVAADPVAIDLYLRARHELRRVWHGDAGPAVALLEQALDRAPGDPTILAAYATARARLLGPPCHDGLASARGAAERAIAAAPSSGDAWVSLATVHLATSDAEGAVIALRTALDRAPRLAKAHEMFGRILLEAGVTDEAIFRLETALALDPTELSPRWTLARAHLLLGDHARAIELLDFPVENEAARLHAVLMRARFGLYRRRAHGAPRPTPGATTPLQYACLFHDVIEAGRVSTEQRCWLAEKVASADPGSRHRALFCQHRAEVLGFCGDVEGCLAAVASAVEAGLFDRLWLERCPLLAIVRGDLRFFPLASLVGERAERVARAAGRS